MALTGRRSFYLSVFGMACAAAGRRPEAERVIDELLDRSRAEYVSPLWLADITTQLGEVDRALEWLERAYEARTQALISLGVSPLYDSLRHDGRFTALLKRIGIEGVAPSALPPARARPSHLTNGASADPLVRDHDAPVSSTSIVIPHAPLLSDNLPSFTHISSGPA